MYLLVLCLLCVTAARRLHVWQSMHSKKFLARNMDLGSNWKPLVQRHKRQLSGAAALSKGSRRVSLIGSKGQPYTPTSNNAHTNNAHYTDHGNDPEPIKP